MALAHGPCTSFRGPCTGPCPEKMLLFGRLSGILWDSSICTFYLVPLYCRKTRMLLQTRFRLIFVAVKRYSFRQMMFNHVWLIDLTFISFYSEIFSLSFSLIYRMRPNYSWSRIWIFIPQLFHDIFNTTLAERFIIFLELKLKFFWWGAQFYIQLVYKASL